MRRLRLPHKESVEVGLPPDLLEAVARALITALEQRDVLTANHCRMVGELAGETALVLGLGPAEHHLVVQAGRLHDLGKIGIPDRILHNTNDLDARELAIIRAHVENGEAILGQLNCLSPEFAAITEQVGAHHERWNGRGYPRGLAGEAIPYGGRIIAVADAYSALVMKRSYQEAMSHAEAMAQIAAGAGIHFDPTVVEAFNALDWDDRLNGGG